MLSPKDILFFVISIDDVDYAKYTLPFINKYCTKYGYRIHVLDKGLSPIPPAWYKLLCHRLCESPFIICCDLDIFIAPFAPPIHEVMDQHTINLCLDGSFYKAKINLTSPYKFYKYNSGLMGIPKKMQNFIEAIYDESSMAYANTDCWEQGFLNQGLITRNIPIRQLPIEWNCMVCHTKRAQSPDCQQHYFKHLSSCNYFTNERVVWAEDHFNYYSQLT